MKKIIAAIIWVALSPAFAADPVKIPKSQIGPSFEADVSAYAQELSDWMAHMRQVDADKAAGVPKDRAHAPFPPPIAPTIIAGAVDPETGSPNYQIVDDGPTPDQILERKKAALADEIAEAEKQEIEKRLPAGKIRAMQFRASDVLKFDGVKVKEAMAATEQERIKLMGIVHQRDAIASKIAAAGSGPVGAIMQAIKGPNPQDVDALKDLNKQVSDQQAVVKQSEDAYNDRDGLALKTRDPKDQAFMLDLEQRQKAVESVHRWAAQMLSDMSDLTAGDIDSWKITPFQQ